MGRSFDRSFSIHCLIYWQRKSLNGKIEKVLKMLYYYTFLWNNAMNVILFHFHIFMFSYISCSTGHFAHTCYISCSTYSGKKMASSWITCISLFKKMLLNVKKKIIMFICRNLFCFFTIAKILFCIFKYYLILM